MNTASVRAKEYDYDGTIAEMMIPRDLPSHSYIRLGAGVWVFETVFYYDLSDRVYRRYHNYRAMMRSRRGSEAARGDTEEEESSTEAGVEVEVVESLRDSSLHWLEPGVKV